MKHESGNSQLLNDYRVALINAYSLGDEIKDLYSIVPPRVILGKLDRIIEEAMTQEFAKGFYKGETRCSLKF